MRKTLIDKYGVDNYSKTDDFREFARNQLIQSIKDGLLDGEKFSPRIGKIEKGCIDLLQSVCSYNIVRQYEIHGFFVDGYIKELNIFVEFYEKWHEKPKFAERDVYREEYLKMKAQCKFFIIRELEWKYNERDMVEKFQRFIKE